MDLNKLLEALIANTAALEANTASHSGGAVVTAEVAEKAPAKSPAEKPAKTVAEKPAKPPAAKGPTREEMVTLLTEVKEKFGATVAKSIITKLGASKMAEIEDDKIEEGVKLAKAKLTVEPAAVEEDDGL